MGDVRNPGKTSGRRIVIGGPQRPLLEGLKEVASRTCQILAVSSNFTVIHQAVRLLAPDLVIIDAASAAWELGTIVDRLGSISRDLRILALVSEDRIAEAENDERSKNGLLTILPASASEEAFHESLLHLTGADPDMPLVISLSPVSPNAESTDVLTPRQRDILRLICSAESTKDIARILEISTRTVEFHKYRMMKTLDVTTMAELILFGLASGLGAGQPLPPAEAASGGPAHAANWRMKPATRAAGLFRRQTRSSGVAARGKYFTRG
ncbi:MAG TPA: LuxR C-terminal-related transcriptional regulator [Bryobacteraceae bacterium]|jgi:DNA-binding NarL/FixJ family response regulator